MLKVHKFKITRVMALILVLIGDTSANLGHALKRYSKMTYLGKQKPA